MNLLSTLQTPRTLQRTTNQLQRRSPHLNLHPSLLLLLPQPSRTTTAQKNRRVTRGEEQEEVQPWKVQRPWKSWRRDHKLPLPVAAVRGARSQGCLITAPTMITTMTRRRLLIDTEQRFDVKCKCMCVCVCVFSNDLCLRCTILRHPLSLPPSIPLLLPLSIVRETM